MCEVIPQAMRDDAPERQLIVFQDIARRVGRVLRAQDELPLFLCQALYQDIAVEAGHYHVTRFGWDRDGARRLSTAPRPSIGRSR